MRFFPGMFQTPEPGHIDMCMSDAIHGDIRMLRDLIQCSQKRLIGSVYRGIEGFFIPVDTKQGAIQGGSKE